MCLNMEMTKTTLGTINYFNTSSALFVRLTTSSGYTTAAWLEMYMGRSVGH